MAKYKAYPEYKDSGVEWLGEIPNHWEMLRHKYVAFFIKGKNPTILLEQPLKNTLPYLSMECLRNNINDKYALISNDVRIVLKGQPLIIWDGSNAGEFVKGKLGILSSTMAAAILTYPLYPQYYWYLCISIEPEIRKNATGMGIPHVNGEELKRINFGIPSLHEQMKIATFLVHETAKIDNLIEKQQQLIELLKEKRQAVISHAVTKGLNPDVPMKDSGVEWLGDVPKHWDVCAIKHIVSTPITDGPHETPDFIDDGIPFISAEAISSGVIDFDKKRACISIKDHKRFSKKYSPQFNDIYMVKSGATTGITAIVETYDDFNIWSPLAVIRCNDYSNPYFVINFMRSKPFQTAIELNWSYGTQQNIGMGVIGNLHIARPPVSEAIEIATHLRAKCSKFDELIDIAMMQISIMQERRTALISAAVTGKIDVRDWVAPETQDVEEPQEATA